MNEIRKTTFVNADVVEQFGRNPKDRFNLVIEIDGEIASTLTILISVNFDSLIEFPIELPHSSDQVNRNRIAPETFFLSLRIGHHPVQRSGSIPVMRGVVFKASVGAQ